MIKRIYLSVYLLFISINLIAQIPPNYYDSAEGLTGEQLQATLYDIIKGHTSLSYDALWNAFYYTDRKSNGKVWDMYSDVPGGTPAYEYTFYSDQCGNYSGENSCYNREHSFPKSWFNDASPMYTDLFHLYPTDGYVNGRRSNYPFGEVGSASWTSTNGSKLGTSNYPGYSGTVFEPIDEYKGDFARTYFYMATRYYNVIANWDSDMLNGTDFPAFTTWAKNMLMEWHDNDPVSQKEIDRNNVIYDDYQHNRNPFIDHPEYVELIWGSGTVTNYTITATAGANGSISPSGSVTVAQGQSKTFTITPNTGYRVDNVLVNGSSVGAVTTYTFSNVNSNHTISATFAVKTYTITATAGTNGSISPSGNVTVNSGANQTFTITPNANYHIADVLVNGSSVGAVTTYTFNNVTSNQTISATFAINTYTINASAGSNGSISPTGNVVVNHGTNQTFTITPNTNYHVEDVLVNGSSVGAVTTYTFSNVTSNQTISATFAINTHTISASASSFGTISPSGEVSVNHGANQTFSITPNANCYITSVMVDGTNVGLATSYTFSNVIANHTIVANFTDTEPTSYTITASAGENGTISPSGSVSVTENDNRTFTITPNSNYHIADVTVDSESVGAVSSYTFSSVTANHTIHATFAINTYTISATAGANGSISPSGEVEVEHGADQVFTITPNTGYHVQDVLVDGESLGEITTYTFENVTEVHSIQVSFSINTYTITASADENGTISPSGEVEVNHGEELTFTISPNDSHNISEVLVDGESVGAVSTYTFDNVTTNHTIEAIFQIKILTITATAGENGTITPNGDVTVEYGSNQTFTIAPNENYEILDVFVNGTSVGAVNTFTFENITQNQTISATFSLPYHIISATANENGSIEPSGQVVVTNGSSQTFAITPNEGYRIFDVLVNETSIGAVDSYTFENVTDDQSIEAFFQSLSCLLTITTNGDGAVEVNGEPYTEPMSVGLGTVVTLNAVPDEYWQFDSWSGDAAGRDTPLNITMNGNKNVTANFTEIQGLQFTLTVITTGNGSVTVNNNLYSTPLIFDKGTSVSLNAIPDNGWQFDSWSGDMNGRDTPVNLTMIGNKVVNALFTEYTSASTDDENQIKIYPNPFGGNLSIATNRSVDFIRICNVIGQSVVEFEHNGTSPVQLETSSLPKGIYLVTLRFMNGDVVVKKVVKK